MRGCPRRLSNLCAMNQNLVGVENWVRYGPREEALWTAPAERSGDGAFGVGVRAVGGTVCRQAKAAWRCASRRSP